jgi:hypothetical protein
MGGVPEASMVPLSPIEMWEAREALGTRSEPLLSLCPRRASLSSHQPGFAISVATFAPTKQMTANRAPPNFASLAVQADKTVRYAAFGVQP